MGTIKNLPDDSNHVDEQQKLPIIPVTDRVFIADEEMRKNLLQYADLGMANANFGKMLEKIKIPEFVAYLRFYSHNCGTLTMIDPGLPAVNEVVRILARSEPITALFRFSALSNTQRNLISELSLRNSVSIDQLDDIYNKCYSMVILFNSIPPNINAESGKIILQSNIAQLLQKILLKVNHLLKHTSRKLLEETSQEINLFSYFPAMKEKYLIPMYEESHIESIQKCTKVYPKHRRFTPGLLVMTCQHQICYGFEIMASRESTIMVYNMILRNFKQPPKIIIYDNACNLCTTCLMRDPALFKKTTFLIDRFHDRNHLCNPIYSMKTYEIEEINRINSQSCEQLFSVLRRISTQIAYMRFDSIFFNTRYFLSCWNVNKKKKFPYIC